ncbi:MAG: hypothetical protein HFF17_08275 [Oscillospiraceae bacterium]|nr:hypothetical protein [Oscillospiraceae bacterium]
MNSRALFRRVLGLALAAALLSAPAQAAVPDRYEAVRGFSEGLAAVRQNGTWGYVDPQGKMVIAPAYAYAGDFSEGLAVAAVETPSGWQWYAIDQENRRTPLMYPAYVERADGWPVLTDVQAQTVSGTRTDWPALAYHGGYVNLSGCVDVDASMNLVFDRAGRWVELNGYTAAGVCGDGLFPAAVVPTDRTAYVRTDGTAALYFDGALLRPFSQGLAPHGVRTEGGSVLWGFIGRGGAWAVPAQYTDYAVYQPEGEHRVFYGGIAAVRDQSGLWGAIDRTGRTVVPFQYEALSVFSEGAAVARRDGRYGLIDTAGQTLLPFVYDRLTPLSEGRAVAVRDGKTCCVSRWGEERAVAASLSFYFPKDGQTVLPEGAIVTERAGRYGFEAVEFAAQPPEMDAVAPWAYAEVSAAVVHGLVPPELQGRYDAPLNRREFAALAVRLLTAAGMRPAGETAAVLFTDCTDRDVLRAAAWGIVQGRGGGVFDPEAPITRQEAAALLARTAALLELENAGGAAAFADADQVASYAREAVAQVSALGVMEGYPDGRFAPQAPYSRQQACLTIWRLSQAAA